MMTLEFSWLSLQILEPLSDCKFDVTQNWQRIIQWLDENMTIKELRWQILSYKDAKSELSIFSLILKASIHRRTADTRANPSDLPINRSAIGVDSLILRGSLKRSIYTGNSCTGLGCSLEDTTADSLLQISIRAQPIHPTSSPRSSISAKFCI